MGSVIEHRAEFHHGAREVLAAQTDEDALRARLQQLGGKHASLQGHERDADRVRYTLLQAIGAEKLPQAVRALHKGDLIVHREHTFDRDDDGYTGFCKAGVNGVPGEITARTTITPQSDGTVQHTVGEATVRMPLIGGKLETVIAEQVIHLLEMEAEFTAKWIAREPCG